MADTSYQKTQEESADTDLSTASAPRSEQRSVQYDREREDFVFLNKANIPVLEFLNALDTGLSSEGHSRSTLFHVLGTVSSLTNPDSTLNVSQARTLIPMIVAVLESVGSREAKGADLKLAQIDHVTQEALPIATYLNTCRG